MNSSPATLAWVPEYCASTGRALGQEMTHEVADLGGLLFKIRVRWKEPLEPKFNLSLWNLFQIWAHKNKSIPQGSSAHGPHEMVVIVAVKERLGLPKNTHPMSS